MQRWYTTSILLILGVLVLGVRIGGFPDGAPVEICIRSNHPNHPETKPQPPSSFPFAFIASSDTYHPGVTIKVVITGPPFKGYFVQARRGGPHGKPLGEFLEVPKVKKGHPECGGITHGHPGPKEAVELIWRAPPHGSGKVVFLGTILAKYDVYWENIIAKTHLAPNHF